MYVRTLYVCQRHFFYFLLYYLGKFQPLMHTRYAPTPAEYPDAWIQKNITNLLRTCRGQSTYIHERITWYRYHPDTVRQTERRPAHHAAEPRWSHRHIGWLMRTNQPLSPLACAVVRLRLRTCGDSAVYYIQTAKYIRSMKGCLVCHSVGD